MDTQRLILSLIFAGSLFMLWQAWEKEHAPRQVAAIPTASDKSGSGALPSGPGPSPAASATAPAAAPSGPSVAATAKAERVTIKTDDVIAEIDGLGGTLTRLELVKQRDTEDPRDLINRVSAVLGLDSARQREIHDPAKGFVLLERSPERTYVAESGLIGEAVPGIRLPNHQTAYVFEPGPREFKDGEDQLEVRLDAMAGPVKVTKVFVFHRGSYVIDVRFEISNQGTAAIAPDAYFQITRDGNPSPGQQRFVSTFTGPAFYTESAKYEKIKFSDIDKLSAIEIGGGKITDADKRSAKIPADADNGWVAMLQHYFVTAWLPPKEESGKALYEFYAKKAANNLYSVGVVVPAPKVAAGGSAKLDVPLYSGPEEQDKLAAVAPDLDLVVDYTWLTVIAKPLFKVLEWLHKWVQNWGVAIILLTCLIKALFFPLSAASYKSMARMRMLAPRLAKLKDQYGEDRVKMNQAMMELYRTEKINPLGGCLPILVQIPVFISLYWVLLASVEMRNAPFALWIHDLSSRDPYCVLPIIMTATSYIQILLNPTPPDPAQAMVMKIMPLAFGVMFFFFPAGLVLYWVVNNVLSIAQQWQITRMIERGKDSAKR
jgi:YidC/Oxa1 family membrane protein insertase